MNADLPTRTSVEATPLGSFGVSLIAVDASWTDSAKVGRLIDKLKAATRPTDDEGIRFSTLRLIVVAGNFSNEVMRWQGQLERPVGVTSGSDGEAMGKTLTWGDGEPQSTYSVIVLDAGIARGLVEDASICAATLRHELEHVWDNFVNLRIVGAEALPSRNDWAAVKRYTARCVLSEFNAEYGASKALGVAPRDDDMVFTVEICSRALERIADAVRRYRSDRDTDALWTEALRLGNALQQLGRQLGCLEASGNGAAIEGFFRKLSDLSPEFAEAIASLTRALSEFSWKKGTATIEDAIEAAYYAAGVEPVQDAGGLRVVVRPDLYLEP